MSSDARREGTQPPGEPERTRVVVERTFPAAINVDELAALEAAIPHCFELRRVRWMRTFISRDRRRMMCLYDAPDAESVRYTQDTGGLPYDAIWAGALLTRKRPPQRPDGYSIVVVEREMPQGLSLEQFREISARASGCLQSYRVLAWESVLSLRDGRALCAFYAPDADSARSANLESGVPMTRAWSADVFDVHAG